MHWLWDMVSTSKSTIYTALVSLLRPKLKLTMTTTTSSSCRGMLRLAYYCPSRLLCSSPCRVTPNNRTEMKRMIENFNCGEDCPIFSEMYEFCRMYAGASIAGARKLAAGTTDIAINWSGGLHHAKRGEASGFCYVNDIVLAILELLR